MIYFTCSLLTLSPDKGKGWVIVQKDYIAHKLQETINANYKEFVKLRSANKASGRERQPYTHTEYLDYRESRVGRHVKELQKTSGLQDENEYTISKNEAKRARTQASSLAQHAPFAKIHKFDFLDHSTHGDGIPIDTHIEKHSPELKHLIPIAEKLKYRFVSPLKFCPSSPLGKLINTITKPIQNSSLRIESISGIADAVQQNLRKHPLKPTEEYVSFDVVSFYDKLDCDFVKICLGKLWPRMLESSERNISLEKLNRALEVCWEDGVLFKDKIFIPKFGAPTGHPVSSAAQNIVMTSFEYDIIQPLIDDGLIDFYARWVDDTLLRIKSSNLSIIKEKFASFHKNLQFTVEKSEPHTQDDKTFNFLPFLDFSINWNTTDAFTQVYRKKTSSTVVLPYSEFGPTQWKIGTLIGFIRRAMTHTSPTHMKLVHKELSHITKQFVGSGYPKALISEKINTTLAKMLNPDNFQKITKDPNQKWLPLFLPWSGDQAHSSIISLKRSIPSDFACVTFAYSTSKLRALLPSFSTSSKESHKEQRFLHSNLVYKYTCVCEQVYIGETERRLAVRVKEHQTHKVSAIFEHIQECAESGSHVERDRFTIVAKRLRHRDARKRFESIYIRYYDKRANNSTGTMNNCKTSRELVIF